MQKPKDEDHVIEPGQEWEADLFRPEDAQGVVKLFLSVYGKDYPVRTYIDPELLTRENVSGRTISCVARTPRGDIVGHSALFHSAPFEGTWEVGAGVVHADYRGGRGIFTSICRHSMEVGAKRGAVQAVFGESVCNHVFSQKMMHGLGYRSFALEVDLMPGSAYEKEGSATGRVASLVDFKTIQPRRHNVFVPPVYKEQLGFLYSSLDDEREIREAGGAAPPKPNTRWEKTYFDFAQVARVAVWEPGADFKTVFRSEEKRVLDLGAVVLQVWLNLAFPWVDEAVRVLRGEGYFLGGLLPRWFDTDGLLMQKILKRPDWESMQIHFDRSRRIRDLVHEDWLRATAPLVDEPG